MSTFDENNQCTGCGAHIADPCDPECPGTATFIQHMDPADAVHGGPPHQLREMDGGMPDDGTIWFAIAIEERDDANWYVVVDGCGNVYAEAASPVDLLPWLAGAATQQASIDRDYARNGLPETALCFECKAVDGIERKVLAQGPVTNLRQDPTQTYRLECGHLAI